MSVCRATLYTASIDEQEWEGGKERDRVGRLAHCAGRLALGGLGFHVVSWPRHGGMVEGNSQTV